MPRREPGATPDDDAKPWLLFRFWAMLNLMSPFNIWQWAMTILLFLPGGLALHYGKK